MGAAASQIGGPGTGGDAVATGATATPSELLPPPPPRGGDGGDRPGDLEAAGNEAKSALIDRSAARLGLAVRQALREGSEAFLRDAMAAATAAAASTASGASESCKAGDNPGGDSPAIMTLPQLSLQTPRGRFDVHLSREGLSFRPKGPQQTAVGLSKVPWSDVRNVMRVPKTDAAPPKQKAAAARAYYLVLALRTPLQVGKQQHNCLVINGDASKPYPHLGKLQLQEATRESETEMLSKWRAMLSTLQAASTPEPEHQTLATILKLATGKDIEEHDERMSACHYFKVFRGVEEGGLYPLRTGLLFLPKPALYIPSDDIRRIATGREGQVHCGATYTDIQIELAESDKKETFSNLPKADVVDLMHYASRLAERAREERLAAGDPGSVSRALQEDDDEEVDKDFEPDSDSDEYAANSDSEDDENEVPPKRKTPEKPRSSRAKKTPRGPPRPTKRTRHTRTALGDASASASGSVSEPLPIDLDDLPAMAAAGMVLDDDDEDSGESDSECVAALPEGS